MAIQIDVTAKNTELSADVEDHIRARAERLEHFYSRILSIRTVVEGPGGHHKTGGKYKIRILIGVPGNDIVINHQAGEDVMAAVRDAFDAATRKVEEHSRKMRGDVKSHTAPPPGE